MGSAPARALEFEDFVLDLSRGCLMRGEAEIELRPKSFDLLQTFAENPSCLLSKDELLCAVWPNVTVTEDVLTHCISEVRRALDDRERKIIKTIPKRGYLFAATVYPREMHSTPKIPPAVARTRVRRDAGVGGRGRMLASGPAAPQGSEHGKDGNPATDLPAPITDRPSLAVLPFENLSEDRTLGLVADGLVEDVITLLARIPGFFVISRRSSLFYADRSRDIRQVGRELGIRYVVGGSIRGSGMRVRIVANLFEAASGRHNWARQYDVVRRDALELQDQIAADIISELQPQLTRVELTKIRRQRPENLGSWDHYHQAVGTLGRHGFNEQSLPEGIGYLRKAIALDGDFALAYGVMALWRVIGANLSLLPNAAAQHSDARAAADRAIALDPDGPEVIGYAACGIVGTGDLGRGRELVERAVELDPSNAQARVSLGVAQVRAREFERGIENMRLGIRLSPRDSRSTFWGMRLADALAQAGRLDEALSQAQSACSRDGSLYTARVVMASVLARLGRIKEARAAIVEARRIRPVLSLEEVSRFFGASAAAEVEPVWT